MLPEYVNLMRNYFVALYWIGNMTDFSQRYYTVKYYIREEILCHHLRVQK